MIRSHEEQAAPRADSERRPLRSQHAVLGAYATRIDALLGTLGKGTPAGEGELEARLLLDIFRRQLLEHFAFEEENGVLEQAAASAPRFARRIDGLRSQHVELRARIEALVPRRENDGVGWARLHESFVAFRRTLLAHEQAENDLLQRAYLEDLGGGG